jgi:hypothetical protein
MNTTRTHVLVIAVLLFLGSATSTIAQQQVVPADSLHAMFGIQIQTPPRKMPATLAEQGDSPSVPVTEADLIGAWTAELGFAGSDSTKRGWMVLWPDHLWWYGGPLMWHLHGGARWRLTGDTLWLANDYQPYFHPMIEKRILAIQRKGENLSIMDPEVFASRPPYPVPDSVYWSPRFRDTTSTCAQGKPGQGGCGTWVYHVSKIGSELSLILLDGVSRATESVAPRVRLRRDTTLVSCEPIVGC